MARPTSRQAWTTPSQASPKESPQDKMQKAIKRVKSSIKKESDAKQNLNSIGFFRNLFSFGSAKRRARRQVQDATRGAQGEVANLNDIVDENPELANDAMKLAKESGLDKTPHFKSFEELAVKKRAEAMVADAWVQNIIDKAQARGVPLSQIDVAFDSDGTIFPHTWQKTKDQVEEEGLAKISNKAFFNLVARRLKSHGITPIIVSKQYRHARKEENVALTDLYGQDDIEIIGREYTANGKPQAFQALRGKDRFIVPVDDDDRVAASYQQQGCQVLDNFSFDMTQKWPAPHNAENKAKDAARVQDVKSGRLQYGFCPESAILTLIKRGRPIPQSVINEYGAKDIEELGAKLSQGLRVEAPTPEQYRASKKAAEAQLGANIRRAAKRPITPPPSYSNPQSPTPQSIYVDPSHLRSQTPPPPYPVGENPPEEDLYGTVTREMQRAGQAESRSVQVAQPSQQQQPQQEVPRIPPPGYREFRGQQPSQVSTSSAPTPPPRPMGAKPRYTDQAPPPRPTAAKPPVPTGGASQVPSQRRMAPPPPLPSRQATQQRAQQDIAPPLPAKRSARPPLPAKRTGPYASKPAPSPYHPQAVQVAQVQQDHSRA